MVTGLVLMPSLNNSACCTQFSLTSVALEPSENNSQQALLICCSEQEQWIQSTKDQTCMCLEKKNCLSIVLLFQKCVYNLRKTKQTKKKKKGEGGGVVLALRNDINPLGST